MNQKLSESLNINEVIDALMKNIKKIVPYDIACLYLKGWKEARVEADRGKWSRFIAEIAEERNYAESTIEGHLAHFVSTGDIPVEKLVSTAKVSRISEFFIRENTQLLSEAKAALGDDVSYSELRFVLNYLRFKGEVER